MKRNASRWGCVAPLLLCLAACGDFGRTRAPDFTLPALDGARFTLSEHAGRVVLIHFLSMDCVRCLHQLPVFAELQRRYGQAGLVVVVVTFEGTEMRRQVPALMGGKDPNFRIVVDDETVVMGRYLVRRERMPFTMLVNRDGSVRRKLDNIVFTGLDAELMRDIEGALAGTPARKGDT